MSRQAGRGTGIGSLIIAGTLCLASTAAQAVKINVGSAKGTGTALLTVTLQSEGASVAGTQNDIVYTGTTIAHSKTCLRTNTTSCITDADCPLADPTNASSAHEPCSDRPACTASAAGKEGFFSFLKTPGCRPPDCTCVSGTDCTAIRAIIFSLNVEPPAAIPDGPLYTCTVGVPAVSVVLPNSNQHAGDPTGAALTGVGGSDGSVGPVEATITPTNPPTPTDTPTVRPMATNTATFTDTPTVTPTPSTTPIPTDTPTKTPTPSTTPTPTGTPTETPTPSTTPTPTGTPTEIPTPSTTPTPTDTPTEIPTPSDTPAPTGTPTEIPTPSHTPTFLPDQCCGDSAPANGSISTAEATNAILALVNRTPESDPAAQCTTPGVVTTADATKVILNLVNRTCNP